MNRRRKLDGWNAALLQSFRKKEESFTHQLNSTKHICEQKLADNEINQQSSTSRSSAGLSVDTNTDNTVSVPEQNYVQQDTSYLTIVPVVTQIANKFILLLWWCCT